MPFYQEVLDALATTNDARLELLKRLCIAVDRGNEKAVVSLARELVAKLSARDLEILGVLFSDRFYYELLSRVVFLGLLEPYHQLRTWFIETKPLGDPYITVSAWYIFVWDEVAERALADGLGGQLDRAVKAWRIRFWTIKGLLVDLATLRARQKTGPAAQQSGPVVYSPGDEYQPRSAEFYYHADLMRLISDVIWGMQAAIQVMLDRATTDLEAGRGGDKLRRLQARLQAQRRLFALYHRDTGILIQGFIVTRTIDRKHGGLYLDALLQGKAAGRQSMEYDHFDREGEDNPEERKVRVLEILRAREAQVELLMAFYGEERETGSQRLTAEAVLRKQIIDSKLNGKLRLRTNDDWVRYLVAAFQVNEQRAAAKNGTPGGVKDAAWEAVMRDLWRYFKAFTGHPKYNLRDYGTSYLEVEFPRTVTGQLLHDCGAYAVRLAYILSLVGQALDARRTGDHRLELEIRFVVLPNHVGLIISGKGISTWITHNAGFTPVSEKELADLQETWKNKDEHGNKRSAPVSLDATQFWAELAAPLFMEGVNLPYALLTVPKPRTSAEATGRYIWRAYLRDVAGRPGRLFSRATEKPGAPVYQFHLRYLDLQVQTSRWYNRFIVRFWNEYWFKAWQEQGEALTKAFQALGRIRPIPKEKKQQQAGFERKRKAYIEHLKRPLDEISKGMETLDEARKKLNAELAAKPGAVRPGVPHTWADRLRLRHGALTDFDNYVAGISTPVDQLTQFGPPPFATVKDWLMPAPE